MVCLQGFCAVLQKHILPVWMILFMVAGGASAETHKLRVSDPALAQSLVARGGRLVADYGSFQIIESDTVPTAGSGQAELADDLNLIRLNAGMLDTRKPEVQALRKSAASFTGKRLRLVQFAGPIKPEWLKALESSGVQIVSYIPQNAYLVYGNAAAAGQMQSWARSNGCVQWEGDYADDYKIHPRARLSDAKGNPRNPGTDLFAMQLVNDPNVNPATLALIDRLKRQPLRREFRAQRYLNVVAHLPPGQLARIAAQPEVISIQPYFEPEKLDECQDQIIAGNLSGTAPAGPGYLAWLASKGFSQSQFNASGFVVDVSDSGIDNGTASPGHFGLYTLGDPGQPSRVVYNRFEGTTNGASTLLGCDGHGNLNAHILAGYCAYSGFPFADSSGFDYGLGVCPFVKVGSSVIFDPNNFTHPDFGNLQSDAYQGGARISANSWGSPYPDGSYDFQSQAYDALVRDAQPTNSTFPTAGNQQMVIVFAAGNWGPAGQTICSPGSAKNVITIGAVEGVRSLSAANGGGDPAGDSGCSSDSDSNANSADDLAVFSSRGPCADGRMKPDLVAPGTHITGGVAQALAATNGAGTALPCFDASGICALPGSGTPGNSNNFFPLTQQFYTVSSGTSQSTPAVAGACALLRQYFINSNSPPPSPAMTKAWLMNSARYLNGAGTGDTLWSTNQGMGELNLGAAFDGVPRFVRDQVSTDLFTNSGPTRVFTGTIANPSKPFRVTLAWTDAPGNTFGNAFNNDLDLTVTVGGKTYKGNVFAGAVSTTGGNCDRANNVESVFLPAGLSGNFSVTVTAANINSDGLVIGGSVSEQDFALVVYNGQSMPAPVITLDSASLTAENCNPGNGAIDPGETVTVAFALTNVGSANATNLVATLLATNGVVFPGGPRSYGAIPPGGGTVTQSFSFTAIGPCGGSINPVLQLQDGAANVGTVSVPFSLGSLTPILWPATNSSAILIPAVGTAGPASPYPSTVEVSGVTGTVSKVTVTLAGVTHTYASDIDVLLTGPTGSNTVLMSYCGGDNAISNLTLTFDDSAVSSLPQWDPFGSGTYKPTRFDTNSDYFSDPAPPPPYGNTLSVFNGLDPNGTWSLYVQDNAAKDTGNIAQGWWISITTSNLLCCTGAPPPPPVIQSISLSNGTPTVTWSSLPGQTYRLQSTTNLSNPGWNGTLPDLAATNITTSQSDSNRPPAPRFYRVRSVP
jgi:subtilisin-like proprotein convertase family protein